MSKFVVGFDIGSSSSYVVIGQGQGIEAVANEYSDRNTPTIISFSNERRFIGHEAKQRQITNVSDTIYNFTQLLGKTSNNPTVQRESSKVPFKITSVLNHRVGIEVSYLNEKHQFTPEQLYAMQLTKLKEVAEMNLNQKVKDIVLNVPTSFTNNEREAVLEAVKIANLTCISLINDTTASALAYGIYLHNISSEKTVAFIDMGYSNFQSSIVKFKSGFMNVIGTSCESIGGRDFDDVIYKQIKKDIFKKYSLKVIDGTKPGIRLLQDCEKLKKTMSANCGEIPLNIDSFINDKDISCKMTRAHFEQLSFDIYSKITSTLRNLLRKTKMESKDIDSVEITGGSSRIPMVKVAINDIFNKDIRTSLNADESVARGCALQAVTIRHTDKVNSYRIYDISSSNMKSNNILIKYSPELIDEFCRKEKQMRLQVEADIERMSTKNSVEQLIFDIREKLETIIMNDENKKKILSNLLETEDWLYEDGENVSRKEYLDKLEMLKALL